MNQKIIAGIIIVAIIGIIIFMFVGGAISPAPPIDDDWTDDDGNIIGTLSQTIRVNYADGTSVTVGEPSLLWIYNNDKIIDTFTYILSASANNETTVDISNYGISADIGMTGGTPYTIYSDVQEPSTVGTENTVLFTHTFNPLDCIDYSIVPDGDYVIMILPIGSITINFEETSLPSSFMFDITVKNERAVNVEFGTK
jgi:hypothetical protein